MLITKPLEILQILNKTHPLKSVQHNFCTGLPIRTIMLIVELKPRNLTNLIYDIHFDEFIVQYVTLYVTLHAYLYKMIKHPNSFQILAFLNLFIAATRIYVSILIAPLSMTLRPPLVFTRRFYLSAVNPNRKENSMSKLCPLKG